MRLEAILTGEDIHRLLVQLSPLTIRLGESGSLVLGEPEGVAVLPELCVAVVCNATVHWPILGFDVPVALRGLTVRIFPTLEEGDGGRLAFRLHVDHAGVSMLPSVFDARATAMINEELEKRRIELSWAFEKSLTHEFALPAAIESAAAISLVVAGAAVKANTGAMALAVRFETSVRRRSSDPALLAACKTTA